MLRHIVECYNFRRRWFWGGACVTPPDPGYSDLALPFEHPVLDRLNARNILPLWSTLEACTHPSPACNCCTALALTDRIAAPSPHSSFSCPPLLFKPLRCRPAAAASIFVAARTPALQTNRPSSPLTLFSGTRPTRRIGDPFHFQIWLIGCFICPGPQGDIGLRFSAPSGLLHAYIRNMSALCGQLLFSSSSIHSVSLFASASRTFLSCFWFSLVFSFVPLFLCLAPSFRQLHYYSLSFRRLCHSSPFLELIIYLLVNISLYSFEFCWSKHFPVFLSPRRPFRNSPPGPPSCPLAATLIIIFLFEQLVTTIHDQCFIAFSRLRIVCTIRQSPCPGISGISASLTGSTEHSIQANILLNSMPTKPSCTKHNDRSPLTTPSHPPP